MATSYYSTVFAQSADAVWSVIRDFNNYPVWVEGAGESAIEDGKSGDAVGAVRNVLYKERRIRQLLLALSDVERSQTYEFCGPPPGAARALRVTLQVTPIIDGDRAFVEWEATFDCEQAHEDELKRFYRDSFATWLESLRRAMERGVPEPSAKGGQSA